MTTKQDYTYNEPRGYTSLALLLLSGIVPSLTLFTGNPIFLILTFAPIFGFIAVQHGFRHAINGLFSGMIVGGFIECLVETASNSQQFLTTLLGMPLIAVLCIFLSLGVVISIISIKK